MVSNNNQQSPETPAVEATPVSSLSPGLELLNRTKVLINDEGDDPLDLSPKKVEPEPEPETEVEEAAVTEEPVTEEPETDEVKVQREKFKTDLDEILTESTGVNLTEITQVLAELLQWRNDILQLELQQQQQPKGRSNEIPTNVKAQGRTGIQARNYDFRQSEINAMDNETYTKRRQEITNAYLTGRVLKDN